MPSAGCWSKDQENTNCVRRVTRQQTCVRHYRSSDSISNTRISRYI
ncbi:hypothetical protein HU200_002416 [Digitaria exilis]|uniref:Uncharacterized protein n=1 Tax=Digitaria exilis TaxID=1010633 RepID=A0A835FX64_9POAL|nr:hypothetical protein HU200_002416 [Digitaria exilis]